jgi:hypothetical protein
VELVIPEEVGPEFDRLRVAKGVSPNGDCLSHLTLLEVPQSPKEKIEGPAGPEGCRLELIEARR